MAVITAALLGILIITAVIWLSATLSATAADRRERLRLEAEAFADARRDERERRMRQESLLLHCAACDRSFQGPLTEQGCPGCHSCALVIPADEYQKLKARINNQAASL